jgi:FAD/FMN-containing dehydrogenase
MQRRTFFRSAAAATAALALRPTGAAGILTGAGVSPIRRRRMDVDAVTGDGRPVTLTASAIDDLRSRLHGQVLLAEDEGYEAARRIMNPSFDRHPALIARVTGPADVRAAVDFARDNGGLLLAVKCGGHSFSGASTCDRGMMIDLSTFRDVRVDPAARKAWVAGGTLLGQIDHEAMSHGLVTPVGTVSHTGVGGLVTGGGFGRLGRRFGLSIDNLTGVQVVTADGRLLRANDEENADLFWGVRGGGGNFGVVTSFEFRLHPMERRVIAGDIVYPIAVAREALNFFAEYGKTLPDDMNLGFGMAQPPGNEAGIFVFDVFYSGPPERADALIAPIRRLGTPIADSVGPADYLAVQRSGDVTDPRALAVYLKSGFVPDITPRLIEAILDHFEGHPERGTAVFCQEGGGAINRVAPDATAFSQRDVRTNLLAATSWRFGTDGSRHAEWVKNYWNHIDPFTYGFYVNDLDPDHTAAAIQANYRQNLARLVALKNTYDPANLFRLNANIRPTAGGASTG